MSDATLAVRSCAFPECDRPLHCKGYCDAHYRQLRRGAPLGPIRPQMRSGEAYARLSEGLKLCAECLAWKSLDDFQRGSGQDGRHTLCRLCNNDRSRKYRRLNPEKIKESLARWHRVNPDWLPANNKANKAIRRAREREATVVPFTAEQLAQRWAYYSNRCWLCSLPAEETDHVKPLARGGAHMLANFRPICGGCNRSKNARWPIYGIFRLVVGINSRWP